MALLCEETGITHDSRHSCEDFFRVSRCGAVGSTYGGPEVRHFLADGEVDPPGPSRLWTTGEHQEEKTGLIELGRSAQEHRGRRGEGKRFDLLGFTHMCGEDLEGQLIHSRRRPRRSACGASCTQSSRSCSSVGTRGWRRMASGRGRRRRATSATMPFRSPTDLPRRGGSHVDGGVTASNPTGPAFVTNDSSRS